MQKRISLGNELWYAVLEKPFPIGTNKSRSLCLNMARCKIISLQKEIRSLWRLDGLWGTPPTQLKGRGRGGGAFANARESLLGFHTQLARHPGL